MSVITIIVKICQLTLKDGCGIVLLVPLGLDVHVNPSDTTISSMEAITHLQAPQTERLQDALSMFG